MSAEQPADRVSLDALLAHRDWVRALARRLVLDENDADDVVQETWRMAIEKPPLHVESPRGWLATVVRNAARMSGRSETRRAKHEAATPERAPTPSPADLVAAAEMQTRLARAVLDLDEPYRSTVLYRFNEGLETSEIAARLGVPVETVRTRLKRAIEQLRERMDVDLGDDRDAWCLLVLGVPARDVAHLVPTAGASASGAAVAIGRRLTTSVGATLLVAAALLVAGAAWWVWPKPVAQDGVADTAAQPAAPADSERATAVRRGNRATASQVDDSAAPVASSPATAPQAPLGPDVIHGRVIDDETGKPVAGVVVTLLNGWLPSPPTELTATTAADGTFRVPRADDLPRNTIRVRADGYAESISAFEWFGNDPSSGASTETNDAGDVRIYRGRRVAGRVCAADGRTPVAGARIRLSTIEMSVRGMWINRATERGVAAADGTFLIERVPPSPGETAPPLHGSACTVIAVSPAGLGWTKLPGDFGRVDTTNVVVALRPTGVVTATVRDAAGAPQVGLEIVASPRFEPLGTSFGPSDHEALAPKDADVAALFVAKTDAQGVARFTVLPTDADASLYDFIVLGKNVKAWTDGVTVRSGADAAVEIVLPAARKWAVAGVVRRADGAPAAGATVASRVDGSKTAADADGRFRFDGIEPSRESYGFEVAAEGCATVARTARRDADQEVVNVNVVVQRAMPVAGRVVDQDGRPVGGVAVWLEGPRSDGGEVSVMPAVTGADGKFAFDDAPAGSWKLLVLSPKPWDEWDLINGTDRAPVVHGGDRDVVAVLHHVPPGKARLVVTVVDETGAPLAPDNAWLGAAGEGDARLPSGGTELGNGRVVLERVKAGRWRLSLQVPGRIGAIVPVDVADGQTGIAMRVVVGRPGRLRGRVELGDSGAAMPHAVMPSSEVTHWSPRDWTRPHGVGAAEGALVRPDGTFEFPEVVPGRWRVSVAENGAVGECDVDVPAGGEATAVVTLRRAAVASFRLGAASPSSTVVVEVAQGGESWRGVGRVNGQKGRACVVNSTLKPGTYRWRVTFPGAESGDAPDAAPPVAGEVTLGVGETVVVDVPVAGK